ncbi:hypothetical protein [Streptomyces johnsoniae]|uniref:Uncharacterized protein n=1 Tax=Streptomyces johnsoniae TaxID=3075532 RepID=A0ABU2SCW3_9ACTN|nr:hypothetical protein [Streptomyces sp. DSM 41886]MDT0446813.1 hypothetical protein [Streptomyces sp. DSM 41886]
MMVEVWDGCPPLEERAREEVAVRAALEGPVRGVEQYTVRLWPTE